MNGAAGPATSRMPDPPARVTVCMAVANGLPHLQAAVDSILAQAFPHFAFHIVDDGSTDDTRSFLRSIADHRVQVVHQDRSGLSAALNRCLATADSEYIARMDADDIAKPERLAEQLAFMDAHREIAASGTSIEYFADDGGRVLARRLPVDHDSVVHALVTGGHGLCHPTLIVRRDAARRAGGYRIAGPGQLAEFALRLARLGRLANLDRVLLAKRVHPGSVSWRHAHAVAAAESEAAAAWHASRLSGSSPSSPWATSPLLLELTLAARAASQVAYRRALISYLRGRRGRAAFHAACATLLDPARALRRLLSALPGPRRPL